MPKHHNRSDGPWQEQANFQNTQVDPVRAVTESNFCQEIDHKMDKRTAKIGRAFLLISATLLLTICAGSQVLPFYYPVAAIALLWGSYFILPRIYGHHRKNRNAKTDAKN
jgi:hypothetical protein